MTEDPLSDAADELGLKTADSDSDDERPQLETAKSLFWRGASDGSLALFGGGAFVLAGIRSVARGRFRAIGQLVLGGVLLKLGRYQRGNRDQTAIEEAIESASEGKTDAGETADGKSTSGEPTGPDPEQTQPSQTEGTEPEESVEEDDDESEE